MAIAKPIKGDGTCDVSTWGFVDQLGEELESHIEAMFEKLSEKLVGRVVEKHVRKIVDDVIKNLMSAAQENEVHVSLYDKNLDIHYPLKLEVESPYGPYEGEGMHYRVALKEVISGAMEIEYHDDAVKLLGRLEDMLKELYEELPRMKLPRREKED